MWPIRSEAIPRAFTTEPIDKFRIREMVKISGLEPRSRYTLVVAAAIIIVGSVQRLMKVAAEGGT
jgi:hypothetical protein